MISEIKKQLTDALKAYREAQSKMPSGPELRAKHMAVKSLQAKLSEAITDGAKPCPICKQPPQGMEQPTAKGVEYEVGCLGCKPFKHTDGTTRRPAVRGGLLPKHTVEAWNEGPDHWVRV